MKWHSAYEILQSDGVVRLPQWNEGEYIYMAPQPTEDGILYLMNQDNTYIELTESELRSDAWIEVVPQERSIEDLTDRELLIKVKARCGAKLNRQSRLLTNRLRFFAERQNALPVWEVNDNLKYYIAWSGVNNQYYIESSYKDYYNGVVHFSSRTACQTALATYRPMLDMVRKLDCQYNLLCSVEHSREDLLAIDKMLDKIK